MNRFFNFILVVCFFYGSTSYATVKFDGNCFLIDGVLLLQDADDTLAYYYSPKYPTLAMKNDSTAEFLFMKYAGAENQSSGGLFHALFEFTISDAELAGILIKLKKKIPKAHLKGRLPFLPTNGTEGDFSGPTFEIISSILSGDGGLARSVIASGQAPMTPGSKAAVAALLDANGANLFWKSLTTGPTSDISIGVKAYYEAILPSYNAIVSIDMEEVYSEFANSNGNKKFFSQKDISNRIDSIAKKGGLKIEIADRTQALDIDNSQMAALVDLISAKVTDLMFGVAQGAVPPPQEVFEDEMVENAGMMGMDPMMMMMMMQGMAGNNNAAAAALADNSAIDKEAKQAPKKNMNNVKGPIDKNSSKPTSKSQARPTSTGQTRPTSASKNTGALPSKAAAATSAVGAKAAAGAMIGFMAANALIDKTLQNNKKTYVLNKKSEVKLTKYKVNLSKKSSIKVPFYTAVNLSLFYQ